MSVRTAAAKEIDSRALGNAFVVSSGFLTGCRVVASEEVDRAFGMPIGKLRNRAGIESVAYAAEDETEMTLGARAGEEALRAASCGAQGLDWIIATSETHHDYPGLAAQLHSQLLAREDCGALDVGGGCLGLLNALAVAQSLIGWGRARTVAVVTADVHSRVLTPERVAGEFGGLFGDGEALFCCAAKGNWRARSTSLANFFLAARVNTRRRFRLPQESAAASRCSLTARRFRAPRLRGWKKSSPPWKLAAGFHVLRLEALLRTSRIPGC